MESKILATILGLLYFKINLGSYLKEVLAQPLSQLFWGWMGRQFILQADSCLGKNRTQSSPLERFL